MDRLIKAFFNSVRAFNELIRSEKAFPSRSCISIRRFRKYSPRALFTVYQIRHTTHHVNLFPIRPLWPRPLTLR